MEKKEPGPQSRPPAEPGRRATVERVSLSLPPRMLGDLDAMVARRGFASRSQAVAEMLHRLLIEEQTEFGEEVMVGTLTLFYGQLSTGVEQRIGDLQRAYIDEVISSFHVHLNESRTLEVLLLQGPARKLQAIADEMITVRGVISGRLQVVAAIIPQIHPFIRQ
ncbi:nickel-responsive transcriptional regulator NikR [Hansschlegelia plantiphila]|uniref:Putative nickel-responsive regulator n=1 Tax=Hansschlegelia plantiphila TaxID=374655 RepID=A0A9W6J5M7_9HYPH|nr:nickel-responsive transcriptional regulator NikR [Hansschlegelia plantiphila]GLK69665.1 CopG family transcriptional regulator [Hansschlegelia plantiphila]